MGTTRAAKRHSERCVLCPRGVRREACAAPQLLLMVGLSWIELSTFPSYLPGCNSPGRATV
eukprot:scaffold67561_cov74-Phaeocystis_antarctica.AAC.1